MHFDGYVGEVAESGKEALVVLRLSRLVRDDRDEGRQVPGTDAPQVKIDDAVVRVSLDGLPDLLLALGRHFGVQEHTARVSQEPVRTRLSPSTTSATTARPTALANPPSAPTLPVPKLWSLHGGHRLLSVLSNGNPRRDLRTA